MRASKTPTPPRLPGIVAGRYEPVRELGRGGMGVVYEAVHTWTGRRVALKTLLAHLAGEPAAVERFRREARAGVQGAHPHIVEVLDMGIDDDGVPYLAQELLVGEDLAALLKREGTLPLRRAYELLVPVMAALDAAHRAGVVHRDVKPGNVFLARRGDEVVPKVIDFGIAALSDAAPVTRTGAPIGTPQYMAPEQARGARDIDRRADVWAVGCLWFEALTGQRPVRGDSYQEVIAALLAGPTPSLRAAAPALPDEVCRAVEGALQPDRARRHGDVGAFARALFAAPACADEPWGAALAKAFPFPAIAPSTPLPDDDGPVTLDLPVTPASDPVVEATPAPASPRDDSPAVTTAPSLRPAAPAAAPQPWRAVALVSLGVALASVTSLALRRDPSPVQPVAAQPVLTQPVLTQPVAPQPVAPQPVVTSPARPVAVVDAAAPALDAAPATPLVARPRVTPPSPRRRVMPAASAPAAAPRAGAPTVINGAPVLEP